MKTSDVIRAWGRILKGERPSLSIEITRECPLRCPGCYAYGDDHLGGGATLRSLSDRKGQELIDGVLELVDRLRPLHLSIVGGDPLVRYRELEVLVPQLLDRGIHVQVVTSAFRPLPAGWGELPRLTVVVSIDGQQPEHDIRRAPATYDRILKNIAGHGVTIHCTITGQMMKRPEYLRHFLQFWTPRKEIRKVWFSLFTPQSKRASTGDSAAGGTPPRHRRFGRPAEGFSKTRHERGADPSIRESAEQSARLHLRPNHGNHFGGFENPDRSLPVRRQPGLLLMRMHRIDGLGRHCRTQACAGAAYRSYFPGFGCYR